MKQMTKETDKINLQFIQMLADENKHLNLALSQREKDIREHYLPNLQQLFNENLKLQYQVFDAARAYFSMAQLGTAAEKLGIDISEIKLPEQNPYEGFEHRTELMESGKVKTTMTVKRKRDD